GCCPCPLTHADIAASTAYVLDVELFPEMLGQTLRNQAAEYIRRTTGRVGNDHTYGSRWIGLRLRKPRQGPDLDERWGRSAGPRPLRCSPREMTMMLSQRCDGISARNRSWN